MDGLVTKGRVLTGMRYFYGQRDVDVNPQNYVLGHKNRILGKEAKGVAKWKDGLVTKKRC